MTIRTAVDFLSFPPTREALREYFRRWGPVLSNLISSDVYTMASAISTCAVLSFFPFTILLISVVQNVFRFETGVDFITSMIEAYLPYLNSQPTTIAKSIKAHGMGRLQLISGLILITTAMGVFIPIEVTLNRILKAPKNMSFIKNQLISFGVILLCGLLSLASFLAGGISLGVIRITLGQLPFPWIGVFAEFLLAKLLGFVLSIALFFVIFYLLPNIRTSFDTTIRASIFTGVVWELGKYFYLWSLVRLDLRGIYGTFTAAVILILWSYVSAMIMILGAELAERDLLSFRLFRPAQEKWRLLHADRSRLG